MNAHIQAFFIKFILTLATAGVLAFTTGIRLSPALLIALVLTVVTFFAADIPFLAVLGRELTIIVDVILAIPLLWALTWFYTGTYPSIPVLIVLAAVVAVGEWFFHEYSLRNGLYRKVKNV